MGSTAPPLARRPTDLSAHRMANFALTHCLIPGFSLRTDLRPWPDYCSLRLESIFRLRADIRGAAKDLDGRWHLIGDGFGLCSRLEKHAHGRKLYSPVVDASAIPTSSRCGRPGAKWPRYLGVGIKNRQLVLTLVQSLGSLCAICRVNPWRVIDHDHITGAVRGLLCGECNSQVDRCRHIHSCNFADYLNLPPAVDLQLSYPPHAKVMRRPRNQRRWEIWQSVMSGGVSSDVV